jgi:hypothetical protein
VSLNFFSGRARMRSLALAAVGLGAADPGPYLDLLGPGESDAMRAAMLTMSGCGLTVRALWREIGMKDDRLEPPYEPGAVMTSIQSMAHEADAWSDAGDGLPELAIGDVVYVSEPDHVGTIVDIDRPGDGSVHVTTVDGGSQDASGRQVVVTYKRAFAPDGDVTAGPMAGQGRRVFGTVALPAMLRHFGGSSLDVGGLAMLGAAGLGAAVAWRNLPALRSAARGLVRRIRS